MRPTCPQCGGPHVHSLCGGAYRDSEADGPAMAHWANLTDAQPRRGDAVLVHDGVNNNVHNWFPAVFELSLSDLEVHIMKPQNYVELKFLIWRSQTLRRSPLFHYSIRGPVATIRSIDGREISSKFGQCRQQVHLQVNFDGNPNRCTSA